MNIKISENIRKLRKQKGMMQEQLAEALGVSVGAVSKWERAAAVPDLAYIMEMADLFGVSVDALVGYELQDGTVNALEERIHVLQREKNFELAAIEAEKALIRYPNNFLIVYRCGEMYQLKGIETGDTNALYSAVKLLNHAILLLHQNTNQEISEFSIRTEIAQCYLVLGEKEKALDLLKKYNMGGVHNALIGLTYAVSDNYEPEESAQYLMEAFSDILGTLLRTMIGYANYYSRTADYESSLEVCFWLAEFVESIKKSEESVTYVDKIRAAIYAKCARLLDILGNTEDMEVYLQKAYKIAKAFDASPVYNVWQMKFCIGDTKNAVAYDDMGKTAMDAIERLSCKESWSDNMRTFWEKIHEE